MGCVNSNAKTDIPETWPKEVEAECILYKTWDESILANHVLCAFPKTEEDVLKAVNWAFKEGWKVRATGIKHNWSPLTITNQGVDAKTKTVNNLDKYVLINFMKYMNKLLGVETLDGKHAAKAQTGISNSDLLKALENTKSGELTGDKDIGYGWAHGPAPDSISLGGMLAINGHGTAVPHEGEAKHFKGQAPIYGTLSNRVLAVRAVVWDEEKKEYTIKEFKRSDGDKALPFLTQLGRAILTEATLQVEKNYYMRCQSFLDLNWKQVFPPTADWQNPAERSLAWYLKETGRVEVIWFPFTENPWVHIWTVTDHNKPEGCKLVENDCNYPFTDKYDDATVDLFKALTKSDSKVVDDAIAKAEKEHENDDSDPKTLCQKIKASLDRAADKAVDVVGLVGTPRITPALNRALFGVLKTGFKLHNAADIWGTSRTSIIYVRDTTLQVTANGYVVMTKEENVQDVMYQFANIYHQLLDKYRAEGKFPIANPLEIRVTGLDDANGVGNGNVSGAPMTSLTYDEEAKKHGWNRAVWLDVLSMPGAQGSAEFYVEMENIVMNSNSMKPPIARVRPEWSKGWGYTDKGPWKNESFINHTRASLPRWNEMVAALDQHDPHKLFTNDWLATFLVPVGADGAPKVDESQYDLRSKSAVVAARAPIGVHVEAGKTYYWCTCGKSKTQPFCDGSHQGSEFKPLAWTATEAKEVYFCACKKTKNAPFCDGAHASLPAEAAPAAAPAPAA